MEHNPVDRVAQLEDQVARLTALVDELRGQRSASAAPGPRNSLHSKRSRRDLIKLAGAAAAGGIGAVALRAVPAAATNGSGVILGNSGDSSNPNTAESATEVKFDGTTLPGVLLLANETAFNPAAAAYPAALAGWAMGNAGVYGFSESGYALVGNGFTGGGAVPLHLAPRGIPTTGTHALGNVAMTTDGIPNVCIVAGTPGTFVPLQLGGINNAIYTAMSTQQYTLGGSDGVTWHDIDATNLSLTITPTVNGRAIFYANADLWTDTAGFNQDIAVTVNGTVHSWKESGGFAGTFSPNAAFIHGVFGDFLKGTTYTVKLQWKANKASPASAHIYVGAGPIPAGSATFSPTRLSVQLITI
jgi:hypothetical protein